MTLYWENDFKDTDLAYAAGLVDGEGYIGILYRKPSAKIGTINRTYKERIQIRMVDKDAIEFFSNLFSISYHLENRPYTKSQRPLYYCSTDGNKACEILKKLLPYLKVKRKIAEKVLEFREFRNNYRAYRTQPPEYLLACEKFRKECSDINHGISLF